MNVFKKKKSISPEELIKVNIGGMIFETHWATIISKGENLISAAIKTDRKGKEKVATKDKSGNIFFDRSGPLFEFVLQFLRGGVLNLPPTISWEQILTEFQYFKARSLPHEFALIVKLS
jgi:hypothetical protein